MKKNLIHIALGLLILSAASCTDEVLVNEYNGLRVSAGITAESRTSFIDDGQSGIHPDNTGRISPDRSGQFHPKKTINQSIFNY
jgi:hypothetical protein